MFHSAQARKKYLDCSYTFHIHVQDIQRHKQTPSIAREPRTAITRQTSNTQCRHRPLRCVVSVFVRTRGREQRGRTLIGLALLPELARGLDLRFRAELLEVFVGHDLTADELVLEVGTGSERVCQL